MVTTTLTPATVPFKPVGTKCAFGKHAKCKRKGWCTCACHTAVAP